MATMHWGMRRPWIGAALTAALAIGCTGGGPAASTGAPAMGPASAAPLAAPSEQTSPLVSPEAASASPSAPAPLPSDIAYAVHQRQQFGLRSDVAWVEKVAADPTARVVMLDIPLLPEEERWLDARQAAFDQVAAAVQAYVTTVVPDQFGGLYLDQPGGHVVALFTEDPERHRQAILDRLGKAAPLVTRQVTYTEAALRALQDRVTSDIDWLRGIKAAAMSIGVDVVANHTFLELSSANPDAPALALAHYGVPADELAVTEDGTGAALLPRGTIDLTVAVTDGGAVPTGGWDLDFAGDGPGSCGEMVGYAITPGSVVQIPCQVGGWTVKVLDENRVVVASGHVTVVADEHVKLEIAVK
jgi:hypothetical protein